MNLEALVRTVLSANDHDIQIHSGGAGSLPASILVPQDTNLQVHINGVRVTGRNAVLGTDKLSVELADTGPRREATVHVSRDGMEATLEVILTPGVQRSLRPVEPTSDLSIVIEEHPLQPKPFDYTEIKGLLAAQHVTYQVNDAEIIKLLLTATSGTCECARGTPPIVGDPERYEVCVAEPTETIIGIVPIRPVASVREGAQIAVHRPGTEGVIGVNVRGEKVHPPKGNIRLPRIGKGASESADGNVYATIAGRIVSTPQLLDVAESMVLEHGLKASDGYIVFDGDVTVRGDVEEGSEIVAGGHVYVSGVVSRAKISADQDIVVVGGVFASVLRAGMRAGVLADLRTMLTNLAEDLAQFVNGVQQLQLALSARNVELGAGQIAAKLLEDKFQSMKEWPGRLRQFLEAQEGTLGSTDVQFLEQLTSEVSVQRLIMATAIEGYQKLMQSISSRIDHLVDVRGQAADIQVRNSQNADLAASGNIVSVQQGFYQCQLQAGQAVRAVGTPGVILACDVRAGRVAAREIGSQAQVHTDLFLTDREGMVESELIHPGTNLQIGTWKHKVAREMTQVKWP